jgi:tripartite-type tricarboxylate transporter receptor subunit TctC
MKVQTRRNHLSLAGRLAAVAMLPAVVAGTLLPSAVHAAEWKPTKPIKLVVPYPPGGATDVAARAMAQQLGTSMGQPVVIENRAGANGMIASEVVFNAEPDGYTFLVATADTNSINPNVYSKMSYDARAFKGVAPIAIVDFVLVGKPGLAPKNLKELVSLAKGGKLNYASWGVGSTSQVAMEMFKSQAGNLDVLHVPYKGAAPAFQAIMGGQNDVMMAPAVIVIPALSKVTAYGIASAKRHAGLPTVQTMTEQGFPMSGEAWVGVLAPPKTPIEVVKFVHKHIHAVTSSKEFHDRLLKIGLSPAPDMTADAFNKYMISEIDRWGVVIKKAGIHLNN